MTIFFDMDGTISNLYAVENWLEQLRAESPKPYAEAVPMLNMSLLARYLNKLQAAGFQIGIISWLSKVSSEEYSQKVTTAKLAWLHQHLKSVSWDEIIIIDYGVNKETYAHSENDILFDDEQRNRDNWTGKAYEPHLIFEILKQLMASN